MHVHNVQGTMNRLSGTQHTWAISSVKFQQSYINNMPERRIWVINRQNIRMPVEQITFNQGSAGYKAESFCIQVTHILDHSGIQVAVNQARQAPGDHLSPMEVCLRRECFYQGRYPDQARSSLQQEDNISYAALREAGGVLYVQDYDIILVSEMMVGGEEAVKAINHPYSPVGMMQRHVDTKQEQYAPNGFFFGIAMRVSKGQTPLPDKWLVVGEKIFRIVCEEVQDEALLQSIEPGYYVTYSREQEPGSKIYGGSFTSHYSPGDEDSIPYFKLYDSYTLADLSLRTGKDGEAKAKIKEMDAKIVEAQSKEARALADLDRVREESTRDRQKHYEDMARLKQEVKNHEAKSNYEKSSLDRKNIADMIKYVPVVLQTVVLLVGLMSKGNAK